MGPRAPDRPVSPVHGRYARKRFGQHFLRDRNVIRQIVDAVAPQPDELIVEIGPGRGALTFPLLESGCELHVVEIDRDLAARLHRQAESHSNLIVHEADALEIDLTRIAPPPRQIRVTGNLPYNISTPLLFRLLSDRARITDMHLMLQREVVQRIVSPPGTRTYGRLSVMLQIDCEVERVLQVASGAFSPAPRVESAVVRLRPRTRFSLDPTHRKQFESIVRSSFSRRRKTLRNALRGVCGEREILVSGLDPNIRPENVTVDEFVRLARASASPESPESAQ